MEVTVKYIDPRDLDDAVRGVINPDLKIKKISEPEGALIRGPGS